MPNIFLDCGFYVGNALKRYQEAGTVDESWTIYAFEPYPLEKVDAMLEARLPLKVILIKKAVWTEDGEIGLNTKQLENASYVVGTRGEEVGDKTVETINFSKFVMELPQNAVIMCSMDIEGAEFAVLRKMITEGTIDRIKVLDIEFHHRLTPLYSIDDSRELISEIGARGVDVRLKEALE